MVRYFIDNMSLFEYIGGFILLNIALDIVLLKPISKLINKVLEAVGL